MEIKLKYMHINYECKAKAHDVAASEALIKALPHQYIGVDHQIDTYFNTTVGRLKLREGNIENSLIHYERSNTAGAKQSNVILYQHEPQQSLKDILIKNLGVKVVVDKMRSIYFIDNVKFHFDTVAGLGTFLEIEAIAKDSSIGVAQLQEQCNYFIDLLKIKPEDFIAESYSDMMLNK